MSYQFPIPFFDGEEIVDDNGGGNSKAVKVDAVDASISLLVLFVEEESFDTPRLFSKSRGGGHKPAVSDGTLENVIRSD